MIRTILGILVSHSLGLHNTTSSELMPSPLPLKKPKISPNFPLFSNLILGIHVFNVTRRFPCTFVLHCYNIYTIYIYMIFELNQQNILFSIDPEFLPAYTVLWLFSTLLKF